MPFSTSTRAHVLAIGAGSAHTMHTQHLLLSLLSFWMLQFIGIPETKVMQVATRKADRQGWCSLLEALLGALEAINTAATVAAAGELLQSS